VPVRAFWSNGWPSMSSWNYFEPAVKAFRVEDPSLGTSQVGPPISARQRVRVRSYAPDDGSVAFRRTSPDGPGFWYPPTVGYGL
jgi:hypothetical protein